MRCLPRNGFKSQTSTIRERTHCATESRSGIPVSRWVRIPVPWGILYSGTGTEPSLVQYLLILGQYLQGTQKSVQAWNTHGLAITAAYQLGLHSPDANRGFSPLEREIRKRTWFGCILLDRYINQTIGIPIFVLWFSANRAFRTLSMTFGRPCIIPQSYVKLDMPLHDMQMLGQSPQLESGPYADGCFFTAAM